MSEADSTPTPKSSSNSAQALVFVSHDTRDAEIAEAFSKLLSSVSAGVLKSFRSSDKKGTQGIEYGVDWYPEIMTKLKDASDVVCLLTPYSVNRPWILYEAGVAKGQLETPVHGLALGIALSEASTGPFAQFQNSDDTVESITSLVMQLVGRIPNAEPDRDVVIAQVESFRERFNEIISKQGHAESKPKKVDNSSVAKLFEEIKVMYQDLPGRIENRLDDGPRMSRKRRRRRFHPMMMIEESEMDDNPCLGLLIWLGQYRDDAPWFYDLAYNLFLAIESRNVQEARSLGRALMSASKAIRRGPLYETFVDSKDMDMLVHELPEIVEHAVMLTEHRLERDTKKKKAEQ